MIVIDSGLGGLAVARALRTQAPARSFAYLADTAGFPYGSRSAADITARAIRLVEALAVKMELSTIVLACNTLSTLALADLRRQFPAYHFVGTVPAIKVAASRARRFTLLATPNTSASEYSQQLIEKFAAGCVVDRYGAPNLARYAEHALLGEPIAEAAWASELAPAFHDDARGRTQAIILGCTHYPLILPQLEKAAPWPVEWIDASGAIARQALAQPGGDTQPTAFVTCKTDVMRYEKLFGAEGFMAVKSLVIKD